MSAKRYLLGIDLSTTGAKALLVDEHGSIAASATTPLELSTPQPLWSEQDPLEWWQASAKSIRLALRNAGVNERQIAAVGLTGQMHGLVLLDADGQVLRPAILWNDQRTARQCEEIRELVGKERLIQITGNDALTGFTAPKILWVRENEPQHYSLTRHVLLPKDYLRYRLTGEYALDKADGSGTILFDLAKRDWSSEVLDRLHIPAEWLPETFEGPQPCGVISRIAADETGLEPGTPVVAGGGDQSAQAVGVGAVTPGIVALTLGTSGVVFAPADRLLIEPQARLHAFCHALPDRWHLMGVMLSAAGSLQWFHDAIAPELSFDQLLSEAGTAPPGCEGLLFLPYLSGERTPHPDPLARGAWVGLTLRHDRAHLTRAILEGVAFGLKDSFTLMQGAGLGSLEQVRISGGGGRSWLWRQILADILDSELVTVNTTEGAAFGAALLAAVGASVYEDVPNACKAVVKVTGSVTPGPASRTYRDFYPQYQALYPSLAEEFKTISRLV